MYAFVLRTQNNNDKCSLAHCHIWKGKKKNSTKNSLPSVPFFVTPLQISATKRLFYLQCYCLGATQPRLYLCCQAPSNHCMQTRDSSSCLKPLWNQSPASPAAHRQNNVCVCMSMDVCELWLHRCNSAVNWHSWAEWARKVFLAWVAKWLQTDKNDYRYACTRLSTEVAKPCFLSLSSLCASDTSSCNG